MEWALWCCELVWWVLLSEMGVVVSGGAERCSPGRCGESKCWTLWGELGVVYKDVMELGVMDEAIVNEGTW